MTSNSTADQPTELQEKLRKAAELVKQADALLILAGAGMGVDSGLPDFRGNDGFWQAYPALGKSGLSFQDIATHREFQKNPRRAWGFYGHRLNLYRHTQPHAGFGILKQWALCMPNGHYLYTSNVDGQFQKAGFDNTYIVECHGSIHHLQCMKNCRGQIWLADGFEPIVDEQRCELTNEYPRCAHCGGLARPNILMFDDHMWDSQRTESQIMHFRTWLEGVLGRGSNLLTIEIGAGTSIPRIRNMANQLPTPLIRINKLDSAVSALKPFDLGFSEGALNILAEINRLLSKNGNNNE
ncbi:MAG: SIR2 family NAD-dependent protein deacylase [Limnobacter sp.]|uniref:SIR2 family NAD-dependent protein deacylase n=1 Tax=Limnobacter sp. TaxID=2003368 RepID=UPI00391BCBC4